MQKRKGEGKDGQKKDRGIKKKNVNGEYTI